MCRRRPAVIPLALTLVGCAHGGIPALRDKEYVRLLPYEGLYEYEHGDRLQIAASPPDKILYAVLRGTRYPLRPAGPDTFSDAQKRRVVFQRSNGVATGYALPDDNPNRVFRRLGAGIRVPVASWYPRPPSRPEYRYAVPRKHDDGLPVGSLRDANLDAARLEAMVRRIGQGDYPDVHGVLIVKNGVLVLEEYFYEFGPDTRHPLRSATKSFVSALAGIAIEKRLLGLQDPVLARFADDYETIANLSDGKRRITLEHLLTNASGLDCDDHDQRSAGNEVRMGETDDWVKFILDLPMLNEPGAAARYCSGGVITVGRMVEKAAGTPLETFAREHLFGPLGIQHFDWKFDPDRSSIETFCQLALRPRDMAKFGLLFLRGGRWNGRQVVSREWVEASTRAHTVVDDTDYGYLWWRPSLDVAGKRHQAILATGNGGQKIYLFPELDMVVVLTGGNYNRESPAKQLLTEYVIPAVGSS